MSPLLFVAVGITVVFVTYTLIAPVLFNLPRFAGVQRLPCPPLNTPARVRVNAWASAFRAAYDGAHPHVTRCNLLRPGQHCDEDCLCGKDW